MKGRHGTLNAADEQNDAGLECLGWRRPVRSCLIVIVVLAWISLAASQALAQATSFQELASPSFALRRGENIEIRDSQGKIFKAKLERITATSLTASVNGSLRDFSESDLQELQHRKPDSLKNGMLIGLGAGALAGLVAASAECGGNDPECAVYSTLAFLPTFAGAGLGIGALTDALIHKNEVVYKRPGAPGPAGFNVAPILSRNRAGVRVSFVF
jgi:hypothetical protein